MKYLALAFIERVGAVSGWSPTPSFSPSPVNKAEMHAMAFVTPIVWILKSIAYWGVFRWRTIRATALDCLIIAGAPFLLAIVPLPGLLSFPLAIGLAVYLTMHFTGVELLPDGLFIPLGIEVAFWGALKIFL